jgi:hypothetical protein
MKRETRKKGGIYEKELASKGKIVKYCKCKKEKKYWQGA